VIWIAGHVKQERQLDRVRAVQHVFGEDIEDRFGQS
jgi:hypothetical protein